MPQILFIFWRQFILNEDFTIYFRIKIRTVMEIQLQQPLVSNLCSSTEFSSFDHQSSSQSDKIKHCKNIRIIKFDVFFVISSFD
jgi:hypothetical protein